MPRRRRSPLTVFESVPWLLGGLAALAYSLLSILRFRNITVNSWDNAIFEQAIKAYAHLEAPIVPIKGPDYNILGDHFSPIDALLAPIYRIVPSAMTLLVAQAVLIGISVVVITSLAMRNFGWGGAFVGLLYATSFGIQNAVIADFHEVAFAVPLLALAGAAFVDGQHDRVVWWSLPLVLVKEDLGITVAAIGLALWLVGERRRGAALGVFGLVATAVTVLVVIPAFNAGSEYDYVGTLGGDAGVLSTFFTSLDTKAWTVLVTFGVSALAALASPWALVAVPTLLWRFVGDVEFYWGTDWHYSLVLMPIVFVAMIDVLVQQPRFRWPAIVVAGAVGAWSFFVWNGGSPLTSLAEADTWQKSETAQAAERAMQAIPDDSRVDSDLGLLKHLVTDHTVYWRGTDAEATPDYIVFDRMYSTDEITLYGRQTHGHVYEIIHDDGRYVVARRAVSPE